MTVISPVEVKLSDVELKRMSKIGIVDEVLMLDWTVGQLLNALEHHSLADNTLVYFSSDQGGHTEERGLKGRVEGGHNGVFRGTACLRLGTTVCLEARRV